MWLWVGQEGEQIALVPDGALQGRAREAQQVGRSRAQHGEVSALHMALRPEHRLPSCCDAYSRHGPIADPRSQLRNVSSRVTSGPRPRRVCPVRRSRALLASTEATSSFCASEGQAPSATDKSVSEAGCYLTVMLGMDAMPARNAALGPAFKEVVDSA